MKNLAGDLFCDMKIEKELSEAGIPIVVAQPHTEEVPYLLYGELKDWVFKRAWCYWWAYSLKKGLKEAVARELNKRWCATIRVEGYSGGTSVEGNVTSYHIDTQEGLNAFVKCIRKYS